MSDTTVGHGPGGDAEIAKITKTFAGLARTHRPLEGPIQPLVVAAAVSVDTALKQDSK